MDIDECIKEAEKFLETNDPRETQRAIAYVLLSFAKMEQERRKQQKDIIVPQKELAQKSTPTRPIFVLQEKEDDDPMLNNAVTVF